MLDRCDEPRASTIKGLHWQTVPRGEIEGQRLFRPVANPRVAITELLSAHGREDMNYEPEDMNNEEIERVA
jgi:hypothetical protein